MAIDLGASLDTVVAVLAAEFDTFKTVVAEDQVPDELPVPALVLQITDLEPDLDSDASTGQFPCLVHIECHVIMGHRTPAVRRAVAQAAGAVAAFVHNERLEVPWGPAQLIAVEPDEFAPQADRMDLWRLEWVHKADLGDSDIPTDGVTPTTVLWSHVPDVGPDHEGDYSQEPPPAAEGQTEDMVTFNGVPIVFDGEPLVFNPAA